MKLIHKPNKYWMEVAPRILAPSTPRFHHFFDVPSPGTRVQYHALLGRPLLQPPHQFKVGAQSHANVGGRESVLFA